jgi:hypothetical protein
VVLYVKLPSYCVVAAQPPGFASLNPGYEPARLAPGHDSARKCFYMTETAVKHLSDMPLTFIAKVYFSISDYTLRPWPSWQFLKSH